MLSLVNKIKAGRHLPRLHRLAFAFCVQKSSVSQWSRVYDDFVRSEQLGRLQRRVFEVENECLRSQNVRLECQQHLIVLQNKLKDLHSVLKDVSTVDKRYPALFAEELRILQDVRSVAYDFHLYEESEREKFLALERLLAEGRKQEWEKSRRSLQFLLGACLVGLSLGILGMLASIYLHNYLYEESTDRGNRSLRELATQLSSAIHNKNLIIQTFLQDLAILLDATSSAPGSTSSAFILDKSSLLPVEEDEDESVLSKLLITAPVFVQQNEENGTEMKRLLMLLRDLQSRSSHSFIMPASIEQETKTDHDISALWRTTFVYSLLVVAVPVAYSLLT